MNLQVYNFTLIDCVKMSFLVFQYFNFTNKLYSRTTEKNTIRKYLMQFLYQIIILALMSEVIALKFTVFFFPFLL